MVTYQAVDVVQILTLHITDGCPDAQFHFRLFSQGIGEIYLPGIKLIVSLSVLLLRYGAALWTVGQVFVVLGIEGTVTSVATVVYVQVGC